MTKRKKEAKKSCVAVVDVHDFWDLVQSDQTKGVIVGCTCLMRMTWLALRTLVALVGSQATNDEANTRHQHAPDICLEDISDVHSTAEYRE